MAREYECDFCHSCFVEKFFIWPTDEKRDYCSEECFEEDKRLGQVIFCQACHADVSVPHRCPRS